MSTRTRNATGPRRVISTQAAADQLGVTERTIRNWIAAGILSGYRIGPKLVRVDVDEIDGMLTRIPSAGRGA